MNLSQKFQDLYQSNTPLDDSRFLTAIDALCTKVYFHFFNNYPQHREDLLSEGCMKAISLVRCGDYDPKFGLLHNYLFTGVRNSMTNYISKIREEPLQGEFDFNTLEDPTPAGHCLDIAEAQKMFKSSVEFAGYVLGVMEGRIMMDLWRDCTEQDKKLLAVLIDRHTQVKCVQDLREKCGDLVLWCLFIFAGQTIKFPSSMALARLLRQAQVYNLRQAGLSEREVGRRVGLRRAHIQRIYEDIREIKRNGQKSIGPNFGTDPTADYADGAGVGVVG